MTKDMAEQLATTKANASAKSVQSSGKLNATTAAVTSKMTLLDKHGRAQLYDHGNPVYTTA